MAARRAVAAARIEGGDKAKKAAHAAVEEAKLALGERGPVWWTDGAPDLNRHMVHTTIYADWYARSSPIALGKDVPDERSFPPAEASGRGPIVGSIDQAAAESVMEGLGCGEVCKGPSHRRPSRSLPLALCQRSRANQSAALPSSYSGNGVVPHKSRNST
jgi:hypothetical protein